MPPRIVVVGSINRDLSVRVPDLPVRGQTVLGDHFVSVSGGKGGNQAVAAARYGADVAFVGRLGRDAFGDELLGALRAEGVDVAHVARDAEAASGVALIVVDERGDNIITVAPGANARLSVDDVEAARDTIAAADAVLLQLEVPLLAVQHAASIADAHGVPVVLNPAPACPLDDALLARVAAFTPNATEAEFYTGVPVADETHACLAAEALAERVAGHVVVTVGALGAYYLGSSGDCGHVQPLEVQAVDSTAAGDVFNGVLCVRLAEGADIADAVRHGNAAAALSVTQFGAQSAIPHRRHVAALLAKTDGHAVAP